MRALIISDVHANLQALEAVLQAARSCDQVWNLGDIVGYGANPNQTAAIAQSLPGPAIRGNHDRACAGLSDLDDFSPLAAQAARWTQAVLTDPQRAWLSHLPSGPLEPPGSAAQLVHGSPLDEDWYVVFAEDGRAVFSAWHAKLTFFGHTHVQGGFATNGDEDFRLLPNYATTYGADADELPLRNGARYLLNPGSVGQPRDGDPRAAFAIYDSDLQLITWRRVPYDIAEAQRRIRRAGLPDFLADRLALGT